MLMSKDLEKNFKIFLEEYGLIDYYYLGGRLLRSKVIINGWIDKLKDFGVQIKTYAISDIEYYYNLMEQSPNEFKKNNGKRLIKSIPKNLSYQFHILKIEFLNKTYRDKFKSKEKKILILPKCLRKYQDERCKARINEDISYAVCSKCTKTCNINTITELAEGDNIPIYFGLSPYPDLSIILRKIKNKYHNFGIIGVACIPELYKGMVIAIEHNIPPQGILLNYNGCEKTDVNLKRLKQILNN